MDMSLLDSFLHHPIETLEEALHIRRQIEALEKQLSSLFGNHPPSLDAIPADVPAAKPVKKKGGLSAEGRARIVAALKARHAAARKAKG